MENSAGQGGKTAPNKRGKMFAEENKKVFVFGFIGFIIAVAVVLGGVGLYQVYARGSAGPLAQAVSRILHLPALKVNGVNISYDEYLEDRRAIQVLQAYTKQNGGGPGGDLTAEQMSDQVLLRLANNILIAQAAQSFDISVEDKDLAELRQQILGQFKDGNEVDAELVKRYGWNLAQYEQKVIRPYVLQSKLADKIQSDPAARGAIRARAEEVLTQIKGGADFAKLAEQYGEDGTANRGGDLGFFGQGEMVPQFEAAAFGLKKGELSQALVESPYGYHIVKVIDRKTEKSKDANGKNVAKELVQASHILFRFPTIDKYLDAEFKRAAIHFYLPAHNPFVKS